MAVLALTKNEISLSVTTVSYNNNVSKPTTYHFAGARDLLTLHDSYLAIHGYLATGVCIFGVVVNVLNVIVLTRKKMVSPTNLLLTALAVSDGVTMTLYLPFVIHYYLVHGAEHSPQKNSLRATIFLQLYAWFSVVSHTTSIWITVALAIFRYIKIKFTGAGINLCSMKRARIAVFIVYFVVPVVCLPNFFTTTIQRYTEAEEAYFLSTNKTAEIWTLDFALESNSDRLIYGLNFWLQAVVAKLFPCVILSIVSVLIIRRMRETDYRSRSLRLKAHLRRGSVAREQKTNSTTLMLLVVVILFIVTEFPQGILNLLSGLLPYFVDEVYSQLGDILDIAALTNNCINFILYCTMSQQFRATFLRFFVSR